MKIIVTGGRTYFNRGIMKDLLDKYKPTLIIEGGALGADLLAKQYAHDNEIENKTSQMQKGILMENLLKEAETIIRTLSSLSSNSKFMGEGQHGLSTRFSELSKETREKATEWLEKNAKRIADESNKSNV